MKSSIKQLKFIIKELIKENIRELPAMGASSFIGPNKNFMTKEGIEALVKGVYDSGDFDISWLRRFAPESQDLVKNQIISTVSLILDKIFMAAKNNAEKEAYAQTFDIKPLLADILNNEITNGIKPLTVSNQSIEQVKKLDSDKLNRLQMEIQDAIKGRINSMINVIDPHWKAGEDDSAQFVESVALYLINEFSGRMRRLATEETGIGKKFRDQLQAK